MQQHNLKQPGTPVALTIAGSDNSAGAGIQADLKTFRAFDVYGLTAVTCVVAEVPELVAAVQAVEPVIVKSQIELCLQAFPVAAIKTGMLYSSAIIQTVAQSIQSCQLPTGSLELVVDPVMVASSGDPLLEKSAVDSYIEQLLPLATLITPNLDEAAVLLGHSIDSPAEMPAAAQQLSQRFGCAVLLKGGHLKTEVAVDVLFYEGRHQTYEAPYVRGISTHGTGCTMAAAITAALAKGYSLDVAVQQAKEYITSAITNAHHWTVEGGTTTALRH